MPEKRKPKDLPDKKGLKSMKDFLHDFFNPPKYIKPPETKKVAVKKKKKRQGPTPIQRQLMETNDFMKYKLVEFDACNSGSERVELVYNNIPEESTTVDRLWPTELTNKDSRIRRELSAKGKESFVCGDYDSALEAYNEAILYSSGKGLAHSLARRAAFLLQTEEHLLALRDMRMALEYGCIETELVDSLLDHHTQVTEGRSDIKVASKLDKKYIANYKDKKESHWIRQIRKSLDDFSEIQKLGREEFKSAKAQKMAEILKSIESAAQEDDLDVNFEAKKQEVPRIVSQNLDYPSFSDAVTVVRTADKGRHLVAGRDIAVGEMLCVEEPLSSILAPEKLGNLTNHCLHCHVFSKAPLPCENCCVVVFCSKECRRKASQGYHRYECDMRLYELLPLEGKEMFGYFLALRAVTQRNLDFFLEHQAMFEVFFDLEEPMFPMGETYSGGHYKTLMNLVTHMEEMPESMMMKNAVISVFFLRFLQHGKYFKARVPEKRKGDYSLHPVERFILRLLHHLIAVQCFNSQQLTKLSAEKATYEWEVIGTSINTSMGLINHSCDPNTFRFNMEKTSLLISNKHIRAGEEITMAYSGVQFFSLALAKREYHMLKNYIFQCECLACLKKWPVHSELPDELFRIPNFEQERAYVIPFGDKAHICDEINSARWMASFGLQSSEFEVAQEALNLLSRSLDTHIRKPHLYFVEASAMAEKFAINQYCRLPLEAPEDEIEEIAVEKQSKESKKENAWEPEREADGTYQIKKNFEKTEKVLPDQVSARDKSPTLRKFSNNDNEKKRSVLDRLEDTKFAKSSPPEKKKNMKDEKKLLADSMRRFSAKEEMAERMAAFQPKKENERGSMSALDSVAKKKPETGARKSKTRSQSVNNRDCKRQSPEYEAKLETIPEPEPLSVVPKDAPVPASSNGAGVYRTDAELEEQILKEIALNRQKVRERRAAERRKKPQDEDEENMSPQRRAMLDKDNEMQKNLGSKEEKLQRLVEMQVKKEENLSEKEKQLQEMRERTQRMLEKSRQKELDFEAASESFNESIKSTIEAPKVSKKSTLKDKIISKASDKAKSMNEMAKAMKEEMKKKREEAKNEEDGNLIAFLRKSHKEKGNIYEFLTEKQDEASSKDDQNVKVNNATTPTDMVKVKPKSESLVITNHNLATEKYDRALEEASPPKESYSMHGLRDLILKQPQKICTSSVSDQAACSKTEKRRSIIDHIMPAVFTKSHSKPLPDPEANSSQEEPVVSVREETPQSVPKDNGLPLSCTKLALLGELPEGFLGSELTKELLGEEDTAFGSGNYDVAEKEQLSLIKEREVTKGTSFVGHNEMRERTETLLEKSQQKELYFKAATKRFYDATKEENTTHESCINNKFDTHEESALKILNNCENREECMIDNNKHLPKITNGARLMLEKKFTIEASAKCVDIDETKETNGRHHLHQNDSVMLTQDQCETPGIGIIPEKVKFVPARNTKLMRKKSLSENCLLPKARQNGTAYLTSSQTLDDIGKDMRLPYRNQETQHSQEFYDDQIQVNGIHWQLELENNIRSIEELSMAVRQEQSTDSDSGSTRQHYSQRWSHERSSLSPQTHKRSSLSPQTHSPRLSRSPSSSPRPEGRRPGPAAGRKARSRGYASTESDLSDTEAVDSHKIHHGRKPPSGLNRRKSLSETCLLPNALARQLSRENSSDVDAYGLPKLTQKVPKRSVSLIRDCLVAKKEMRPMSDSEVHKRSIQKETRTTRRGEFKAKFESGSHSNLSGKSSRASTPYRPPQVDSVHLSKVKTKFEEVDPDSCVLPFPNYRSKPPIPR